jgi:F0F1-type ATP synthase membrane subunit b/b'
MEILNQLGINNSVWIQFVLFVVSLFLLQKLVFEAFAEAAFAREEKTQGSQEKTEQTYKKIQELSEKYELEARALSQQIKAQFDQARQESQQKIDTLVSHSRQKANQVVEGTRLRVANELKTAREGAKAEVPELVATLTRKMLSVEKANPKGWSQ